MLVPTRSLIAQCVILVTVLQNTASFRLRVNVDVDIEKHAARLGSGLSVARDRFNTFTTTSSLDRHVSVGHLRHRKYFRHLVLLNNAAEEVTSSDAESAGTRARTGIVSSGQMDATTLPGRTQGSEFMFNQRIESAKAAVLCGAAGSASRLLAVGASVLTPSILRDALAAPDPTASTLLFCLAIGFVQGALFGLTYRYVIRSDREKMLEGSNGSAQGEGLNVNLLGDGCVAAFALTSALAQSEGPLIAATGEFMGALGLGGTVLDGVAAAVLQILPFVPRAAGDLVLYSVIRGAIDLALDKRVIQSYP